jgi:acetolactate synthase-1/2/3 large subunit
VLPDVGHGNLTAARERLPVKFFVLDDQAYHYMQELQQPAYLRTTATVLAVSFRSLGARLRVAYAESAATTTSTQRCARAGLPRADAGAWSRTTASAVQRIEAVKDRYLDELTTRRQVASSPGLGRGSRVHVEGPAAE